MKNVKLAATGNRHHDLLMILISYGIITTAPKQKIANMYRLNYEVIISYIT